MYSLNWDNQERLQKIIKRKEQEYEKLTSKCSQLKQTLAEIKEIITTSMEQNTLINLDKILQKINEVEDDNN
jgi:hypothetical protein